MSHSDIPRMGQRFGSRQNSGQVNPSLMSQKQYEAEIKKQIEQKKFQQMQDKIQEKREIIDHYKNSSKMADSSQPSNDELQRIIREKEQEIAKFDQVLREQQNINPSIGINSNLDFNQKRMENKQAEKNDSQAPMPDFMQRPNYLVNNFKGPIVQTQNQFDGPNQAIDKGDVFGNNNDKGPNLNFAQQSTQNPFLTMQNENNNQQIQNMNNNFSQHQFQMPPTGPPSNINGESERDRRIRLREQERLRRNQGLGEQGIVYGAMQPPPPQSFKPQDGVSSTNIFGEKQQSNKREEMLAKKLALRQSMQQDQPGGFGLPPQAPQVPSQSIQTGAMMQLNVPSMPQQQPFGSGMPPQFQPQQMMHAQNQADRLNQLYNPANNQVNTSLNDREMFKQPFQQENPMLRKSSKSKFNLDSAIELDNNLNSANKEKPKDTTGFLQIGQDRTADLRRENEKKERQAEYQAYLDKQKQANLSPRQLIQRLNSGQGGQQQPQASPNKNHRNLVKSGSQNRPMPPQQDVQNNILGQPMQMQQQQQNQPPKSYRRTASASKFQNQGESAGSLIGGGFNQNFNAIDNRKHEMEEKQRKQMEYKQMLDQQNSQPPNPGFSRPPKQENFIQQSKSVRDEHYVVERRKQLGDEVFNEMMARESRQGFPVGQSNPGFTPAQFISQSIQPMDLNQGAFSPNPKNHQPVMTRRNSARGLNQHDGSSQENVNFFLKNQENEDLKKQNQIDKKKEYAMELQQQMMQKKQNNVQNQKPPSAGPPQSMRPPMHPQSVIPPSAPSGSGNMFPPQMPMDLSQVQLPVHLSQDEMFQQILAKKREEYKKQLDDQIHQKKNIDALNNQKPMSQGSTAPFAPSEGPFNAPIQMNMMSQGMPPQMPPPGQFIQPQMMNMPPPSAPSGPPSDFRNQLNPPQFNNRPPSYPGQGPSMGAMNDGPLDLSRPPLPSAPGRQQNEQSESEMARIKREEYKRELDQQMMMRDQLKQQNTHQVDKPLPNDTGYKPVIQHALPQAPVSGESGIPQARGRLRSDITSEKNQMSVQEQNKMSAYQEELKIQMEQQKAKKEAEKAKIKREEEELEREIEMQRKQIIDREQKELIKDKNLDPNAFNQKPQKKINLQQFKTSAEIEEEEKQQKANQAFKQDDEPSYKPFTLPTQQNSTSGPPILPINEGFNKPPPIEQKFEPIVPRDFGPPPTSNDPFLSRPFENAPPKPFDMPPQLSSQPFGPSGGMPLQPPQLPPSLIAAQQTLSLHQQQQQMSSGQSFFPPPTMTNFNQQNDSVNQQQSQVHEKLLEDQRKMISMYQQALEQILNFRTTFVQEQMNMQMTLMREKEQLNLMQQRQQAPPILSEMNINDYKKQATEIKQISAVRDSLNVLMNKATQQDHSMKPEQNYTQILNPSVQQNLNNFIKNQRDEVLRMSQSMSFKNPSPNENGDSEPKIDSLDQSLKSNSKLINVPSQFTNKLKEKAENFEQQRMNQQQNQQQNQPQTQQNNQVYFAQNTNASPYINNNNSQGLYATWKTGEQSMNRDISPVKQQMGIYNQANPMMASLAGSSQLQYNIAETPINQNRNMSPINQPIVSPYNQRPQTNILKETIEELPEKEGNTNDFSENEMKNNAIILQQANNQIKSFDAAALNKNYGKKTIESDQDYELNNRDDETSNYQQSNMGRKSKVSVSQFSKANTNAIEQNLNFIEQQVNVGAYQQYQQQVHSTSKSPFSYIERKSGPLLSPTNNQDKNNVPIPQSTQKSFFKNANMAKTGMSGAPNPKMTGSSFYNATMAKTKIQEQRQQEELQRQLQNIFSEDYNKDILENSEKELNSTKKSAVENQQVMKQPYQLPLDNSQEIENMSDINIAQSIGQSMEINQAQQTIQSQKAGNIIDQQYNWLVRNSKNQDSQNIIKEQEFESKSREDESYSKDGHTNLPSEEQFAQTVRTNGQTIKQSEMVWNDPDLIPDLQVENETNYQFQVREENNSVTQKSLVANSQQQTSQRKNWGAKPGTAQPYYFGDNDTNQSQSEINIADEHSQPNQSIDNTLKQGQPIDNYVDQIQRSETKVNQHNSKISNLNLLEGKTTSEMEFTSALLLREDQTLAKLHACSPDQHNFNFADDSKEEKIEEMYDKENYIQVEPIKEDLQGIKQQNPNFGSAPTQKQELSVQYQGLTEVQTRMDLLSPDIQVSQYNPNFIDTNEESRLQNRQHTLIKVDIQNDKNIGLPNSEKRDEILDDSQQPSDSMFLKTRDPSKIDDIKPISDISQINMKQESLASKLDRIKGIFNSSQEENLEKEKDYKSRTSRVGIENYPSAKFGDTEEKQQNEKEQKYQSPEKSIQEEIHPKSIDTSEVRGTAPRFQNLEESKPQINMTPMSKNQIAPQVKEERPLSQKQRGLQEIMELAQLVQEATGSINNVVESFQNFKPLTHRQKNFQAPKESVQISRPDNLPEIEQQIDEDNSNDNQIISNLDMMIMNLEKQQKESEKLQSKFSSNLGFVSQNMDKDINQEYDKAIEQSVSREPTQIQKDESVPYQIHHVNQTQEQITQRTLHAQLQPAKQNSNESESNHRATIMMDDICADPKTIMKRPVSGKSHVSNSTRYTGFSKKKQNYEQFQEDDDDENIQRPDTVQYTGTKHHNIKHEQI